MPNTASACDLLADALEAIADSNAGCAPIQLARGLGMPAATIVGAAAVLRTFGALADESSGRLRPASPEAANLIRSFANLIRAEQCVVSDWHRRGADCQDPSAILDRGVRLLALVEERRAREADAAPLARMEISKAIITGTMATGDRAYLMILNDASHCYQLIGGRLRADEDPDTAMHREIAEEMPHNHAEQVTDYVVERIRPEPVPTTFVSPTSGCLTRFEQYYYHVRFLGVVRLSPNHRWISGREFLASQTDDGCRVIPAFADLGLTEAELRALAPSVSEPVRVDELPRAPTGDRGRDVTDERARSGGLLAGTVCALVVVVTTVGALVVASILAADHFTTILGVVVTLVIVALAFIARSAQLIESSDLMAVFARGQRGGSRSEP